MLTHACNTPKKVKYLATPLLPLTLFETMPYHLCGTPDVCTSVVALEEGSYIHEEIIQIGYEWSVLMDNSFIAMYVKCGNLEDM
jgi:hypothetical protein